MGDVKETLDRIRKQAEEIYNEKMKLLDEHKYEEIKQKVIDTKKAKQFTNIEDKAIISMEFIEDMQFLINVIDILEKKSKQDNETIKYYLNSQYGKQVTENINKVQLSSLYGEHKEIYKNVDVVLYVGDDEEKIVYGDIDLQIDENFIKTIAHKKDKDFITIYSVKYIHHLKIRPKGKIEELFESEVEQ